MRLAVGVLLTAVLVGGCSSKPVDEDEVREDGSPRIIATTGPAPTPEESAAPTPTGSPPVTRLSLAALPSGPEPRLAWFDPASRTLRDGDADLGRFPAGVFAVRTAGDGFVVAAGGPDAATLYAAHAGRDPRVLAEGVTRSFAVSPDGSLAAYTRTGRGQLTLVVARTRDGSVVARRRFPNAPLGYVVDPVAVDGHRVLITRDDLTYWWDYRSDQDTPLTHGRIGAVSRYLDRFAASYLDDATRWQVAGASGQDNWSLPRRWVPEAFSPEGSWLLSGRLRNLDPAGFDRGLGPLRISASRDGAPARALDGYVRTDLADPVWEDELSVLFLLGGTQAREEAAWVRCTVAGACARVSPTFDVRGGRSARGPWVLAH